MRVGIDRFDGKRLYQARVARGFRMKDLAELVGVTGQAIGQYERDDHKPTMEVVNKLAHELKFDPDFLMTPAKQDNVGLVFWRDRRSETKFAREQTEQRMLWAAEIFALFESFAEFHTDAMPAVTFNYDYRLSTKEELERLASEVRREMGLGMGPIPNMTLALENVGVPVVLLDVPSDKQDGFQWFADETDRHFVGVNTRGSTGCRVRFDLAHEFAHILLHRAIDVKEAESQAHHKILEIQANYFAGAFLFPAERFLEDVTTPSLDYFLSLKRKWGVSVTGMIERAFALDMIDKDQRTSLHRSCSRRKWRGFGRSEPMDDDVPIHQPKLMRKAFELLVDEGVLSAEGLKGALPLPVEEFEAIIGLSKGSFDRYSSVSDKIRVLPVRGGEIRRLPDAAAEVLPFKGKTSG